MSWSRPPIARWRSVAGGRRSSSPTAQASVATRRVCSSVDRSFSARSTISERTRGPRNASSAPTSSVAARSPTSGARGAAVAQVEHGGDRDQHDAQQLHGVAEVEGPGAVAEQQLRHERPAEPDAADAGQQVGRAAGERVGPGRAQGEQREEGGADDEQHDRRARCRPAARSARRRARAARSSRAPRIATARTACSASTGRRLTGRRIAGSALSASTVAPAGSDAAPARAITPLSPDDDPRGGEPVDREQRGHGREGGAEQHGAAVARPRTRHGEPDRGGGGDERPGRDEPEVDRRRRRAPRARRRSAAARAVRPPTSPAARAARAVHAPRSWPSSALSADQRTMCSPSFSGSAASASETGSARPPASAAASLRASAARSTVAPATRSGSGGTVFGGGSIQAQRAGASRRPSASEASERAARCDGPTPLPV